MKARFDLAEAMVRDEMTRQLDLLEVSAREAIMMRDGRRVEMRPPKPCPHCGISDLWLWMSCRSVWVCVTCENEVKYKAPTPGQRGAGNALPEWQDRLAAQMSVLTVGKGKGGKFKLTLNKGADAPQYRPCRSCAGKGYTTRKAGRRVCEKCEGTGKVLQ
jgi:hypothetical protein